MEFVRLCMLAIACAFMCVSAQAQGHFTLKNSNLLQNCSFIHRDEFSLESFQELIRSQIETRIDGDNQCQAAYRTLNSNVENMLKLVDENVTAQDARRLYGEMYGDYLVSLQTELALLDPNNVNDSARILTLQTQMDTLRTGLLENEYEVELYNRTSPVTQLSQNQLQLFSHISGMVQSLSQMPTNCIGKIGGWKQAMPLLLNATSYIGVLTGQLYMPAAAATIQVGTEIAMILSNTGVKKALTQMIAQRNNQIIACTYQALTNQACELKRAGESIADTQRVEDIINNRFQESREGEYDRYLRAQQMLSRVQQIMTKVGEMGSAVTIDLNLIFRYFAAVRIRPFDIQIPPADSTNEVLSRWLNEMSNRGIEILETGEGNRPLTIRERYENTVVRIDNLKVIITTVIATIREKRSFKDLRDELILSSRNISKEFEFMENFLREFPAAKTDLPRQYQALFTATLRMLEKIRAFVDAYQLPNESYEDYISRVDSLGDAMFAEFSYGSIAQVTTQTVLLIPQVAFERFERPFRAVDHFYLSRDIEERENPDHPSYSTYVINRGAEIRVINLYKNLSSSGQAFRLEGFEATKQSFERSFKKDIHRMVSDALSADSAILGGILKGKTAGHVCALFSDYLKRSHGSLYRKCQAAQKTLPLYQIMRNYRRPIELPIDYNDPCFYNSYRREEYVQSLLFDRLLDYGFNKKN